MTDTTTNNIYLRNRRCPCTRCRMFGMTVPAILFTLGLVVLLENLGVGRGNMIFPMLLIVFGAVRLLQYSASTEGHRAPAAYVPAAPVVAPPPAGQQTSYEEVNRG